MHVNVPKLSILAMATLFAAACQDAPTQLLPPAGSAEPSGAEASAQVEMVARGVALALRQPTLRRQLFEDLRDSRFPEHRIHLRSYLAGERGRVISAFAASGVGIPTERFLAAVKGLPQLQISVPVSHHRVNWAGSDSAVVIGHTIPKEAVPLLDSIVGYSTRTGERVVVPTTVSSPYPLIVIAPAEVDFGQDPESTRKAAPTQNRKTISTSEETYSLQSTSDCNLTVAVIDCNSGSTTLGWDSGVQLPSGYTYQCMVTPGSAGDTDGDGLLQQCEADLAHAFRPFLQWDQGEESSNKQGYFAVKRGGTSTEVKIMYLMGYFADSGHDIAGGAHDGDSEFLVFTVSYRNGWWRMSTAFLSAHWGVYGWDSSSTRSIDEFQRPDGTPYARPKIWIAEDKHANYSSQSKCDEGANYADNCDQPITALESLGVPADRNIGNRESGTTQLLNCVVRTSHGGGGTKDECLWTYGEFSGWQNLHSKNSTGYTTILDAFNF